jgi:hypothetical protein
MTGKLLFVKVDYLEIDLWLTGCQCAIDFGTTYSGVAYAYVEKGQDVSPS